MKGRLILLVVMLVAVVTCYVVLVRTVPAPGPSEPEVHAQGPAMGGGPEGSGAEESLAEYEHVSVEIEIPGLSELPPMWEGTDGCPHTMMTRMLGVQIGRGGGVPVLRVGRGKAAAMAGIRRGDYLGGPGECAKTLWDSFAPGEERRRIEWTVRRPKGGPGEGREGEGSARRGE